MAGLGGWYRHFAFALAKMEVENYPSILRGFCPSRVDTLRRYWCDLHAGNSPPDDCSLESCPRACGRKCRDHKAVRDGLSLSTVLFAEMLANVVPNGLINVVTGYGDEVGAEIVGAEAVKKVSFTGSIEIGGSKVAGRSNQKHNVKPSTLELGGKSPQIVFADADLESAMNGVMSGIFLSNGQSCVAGSRLIIHNDIQGAHLSTV